MCSLSTRTISGSRWSCPARPDAPSARRIVRVCSPASHPPRTRSPGALGPMPTTDGRPVPDGTPARVAGPATVSRRCCSVTLELSEPVPMVGRGVGGPSPDRNTRGTLSRRLGQRMSRSMAVEGDRRSPVRTAEHGRPTEAEEAHMAGADTWVRFRCSCGRSVATPEDSAAADLRLCSRCRERAAYRSETIRRDA